LLCINAALTPQLFRSHLIPQILTKTTKVRTRTYQRAYKSLVDAGLLKKEQSSKNGRLLLNLHDSRLDLVLKPTIRQVALVIENFGPIHLRGLHRCLGYKSLKATRTAVQRLQEAKLLESQMFKERKLLNFVGDASSSADPIDEVPQPHFRAAFTDLTRSLRGLCESAIVLGDFAEGKGALGKEARILVLVAVTPQTDLVKLAETLTNIAQGIKTGHEIKVHQTIAAEKDFISFLNAKRGVWPNIFVGATQGITLLGKIRHDGKTLFGVVQKTLTYPDEKIRELLHSGTLCKRGQGLAFTDLGIKRYVRLVGPPILQGVNSSVSILVAP